MDFTETAALVVALTSCVGIYLQHKQVRLSERQLSQQIHDLSKVVADLARERSERETGLISEREARVNAIQTQELNVGDRMSSLATYGGSTTYHLALCTAIIARQFQKHVTVEAADAEEVDAARELAAALVLTNTVLVKLAEAATGNLSPHNLTMWEQRSRSANEAFGAACRRVEELYRAPR